MIYTHTKIISPNQIQELIAKEKEKGKKVVTLNGSFDLLHAGHLQIIFEAKAQGDILVVALNSDSSIQKYKSPLRPIIPLAYRMEMMAALEPVTYVTWFDELDPRAILQKIRPDVHANGAEYGLDCVEAEVVRQMGAKLYLANRVPSLSTSQIIEKIKQVCDL
jgi:rfaE bifunctional protein nucleotidyltransferase chain/domain